MQAISSESLSKTYKRRFSNRNLVHALQDFSISVQPGEIFSLLGPNGAGKTTFLKILLSLTRASSGTATILGISIHNKKIRSRIGYLPENHRPPGYFTGQQLLSFFGNLSGIPRKVLHSRIPLLLQTVGLSEWQDMKVRKYSKGMLQRIGLAQALINDPDVLFLDEPTDGVDPVGRKEIRDLLINIKHQGKTVFLNSHLLSEVELISDRVAILDKGKLLRVGSVDELTSRGLLYHIGVESEIPESAKEELSAKVLKITYGVGTLAAELTSIGELNAVIDILRKHNVGITSIVKQRSSLEESFLNLIKREVAV